MGFNLFFFFFQAEDGIRDLTVTGVQTCALPIFTVSGGKIVQDENGETLLDDGPVLQATDRLVKIAARRATLLGLDAPARSRIEVITPEMVEAEIARLEAEDGDDSPAH